VSTPPGALFTGLLDDAAMFPPGNASADAAITDHLRYRGAWFADLVGPLLVPATALEAFARAHQGLGSPDIAVVLIGTTALPRTVPAGVTVVGLEARVADVPLPDVPPGVRLAAEITTSAGGGRVLAAVAEQARAGIPVTAKFRTGGTSSDAFPSEAELAGVIALAVAAAAPLKLTAGLHHAVRLTDPATGFEQHGFLNVLVAMRRCLADGDRATVAEALAVRESEPLVTELAGLSTAEIAGLRRQFPSFGCCGVEDPIHDLVELGLVEPR
jgi:hypothetical protein